MVALAVAAAALNEYEKQRQGKQPYTCSRRVMTYAAVGQVSGHRGMLLAHLMILTCLMLLTTLEDRAQVAQGHSRTGVVPYGIGNQSHQQLSPDG